MASNNMFTLFKKLPTEMRLKVWAIASNQEPRHIDLWTDFHRCEQENVIFYAQKYESILADKSPPSILQVSREAREEGLRHYTLEFKTVFPLNCGISQSYPARFYINYATYTLVPRGYWNTLAFWELLGRSWGMLAHLAIDVTGSFWKDNILENMVLQEWVFAGVREITLYDANEVPLFRRGDRLECFRGLHAVAPHDLSFEPIEEKGKLLGDAEALLGAYLIKMGGKETEVEGVASSKEDLVAVTPVESGTTSQPESESEYEPEYEPEPERDLEAEPLDESWLEFIGSEAVETPQTPKREETPMKATERDCRMLQVQLMKLVATSLDCS